MKRYILLALIFVLTSASIALIATAILKPEEARFSTPTYFSKQANLTFAYSEARDVNLNQGITLERSIPLDPKQGNNITFAVFNHTDEPILFPNQGFGLSVFRYDENNSKWEKLQLPHTPYPELTTLPPRTESWNTENNNTWDLLENDTTAFGYKKLRLYVLGKGKFSNTPYGAYLDVEISGAP